MFEIVLRFPDHEEVRLTDRDGFRPGEELTIAHRRFVVVATEDARIAGAECRFILQPVADQEQ